MASSNPDIQQALEQLKSLETLRGLIGEEAYRQARARLEEQLRHLQSAQVEAPTAAVPAPGEVQKVLQARQVNISSDASGNWIITGDNNTVTLAPDQAPAVLLRLYYRALAEECGRLPLGLVNEEFAAPGMDRPVGLRNVYTDLDVVSTPRPEEEDERARRWFGLRMENGAGGERTPLLEAISQPGVGHQALLGLPGSGKTTFVNYLAASLASGEGQALPQTLRSLLPVRLELRHAAAHLPVDACGEPGMLWDALKADIARQIGKTAAAQVTPYLLQKPTQPERDSHCSPAASGQPSK